MNKSAMGGVARVTLNAKALTFSGVALPWKPPIDKIATLVVLSRHNQTPLQSIEYFKTNDCPNEVFDVWQKDGVYPIDIGDRKYHKAGVASATAWLVQRYQLQLSAGEGVLLQHINRNNTTGFLKDFKFAVPYLLRELYELDDSEEWALQVITASTDVVLAYIEAWSLTARTEPMGEELAQLAEKYRECNGEPLTLGKYIDDLWKLGTSPGEIIQKVAFWREGLQRLEAERGRANKEFDALQNREEFLIAAYKGIVMRTDDHFLAKAMTRRRQHQIRMIVASSGHTVISTNQLDLSMLHAHLCKVEPGRWYYNKEMGALINGGPQYTGVVPTELDAKKLIQLFRSLVMVPKK